MNVNTLDNLKLIYIGKSNKRFTHNKIYGWYGLSNEENLWINIKTNNSTLVMFNNNYYDYFNENFKFMNEIEYNNHIRKIKLKKIDKIWKKL